MRFFKSGSGGKITAHTSSNRPGDGWENLQDRIIDAALRGAGWPLMGWSKENPGGQMARGAQGVCRCTVQRRQKVLRKVAKRVLGWASSKGIQIKALAPYPGTDLGGQLLWDVTLPALMSIDDGRDSQNRREDYKIGFRNEDDIFAELGVGNYEDHLYRRARIAGRREQIRLEVSTEMGVEISPRAMQMLTPNEQPSGDVSAGETDAAENAAQPKEDKPK